MDLLEYTFVCPNCNKEVSTYIERSYYQQLLEHTISKNELFNNFNNSYKGLFTIGYCNKCLYDEFNIKYEKYTAESKDLDNSIYESIHELYE